MVSSMTLSRDSGIGVTWGWWDVFFFSFFFYSALVMLNVYMAGVALNVLPHPSNTQKYYKPVGEYWGEMHCGGSSITNRMLSLLCGQSQCNF